MALVSLQAAKDHLRIDTSDTDVDIDRKLEQANDIVIRHLKSQADDAWTTATVPGDVSASILLVLEDLYERRPINWEAIGRLLVGRRDPALA
jgi:hypothetical protein